MLSSLISRFAAPASCQEPFFFGFKPWYHYLDTDEFCNIVNFKIMYKFTDGNGAESYRSDIFLVALAIVDDLLRVAGLVAIGFIIYGGILYITSQGSPDATGKAQSTIQNALIGLIISILAIAMVTFLGSRVA